jgi:NTE family protein
MDTLTQLEDSIVATGASEAASHPTPIEQIVLVLQGGGALAAYQAGVYQALTEGGIEPDWVIGTSIGAINGALIAGNKPSARLSRLEEFWRRLSHRHLFEEVWPVAFFGSSFANFGTITQGVRDFFEVNPRAPWGVHIPVGIERAAFYTTAPLERTLKKLVDFDHLNVSVRSEPACDVWSGGVR